MLSQPNQTPPEGEITGLDPEERQALLSAAAWYANYHAGIIAERTEDTSAFAVVERERFHALVHGLRKLGVRIPPPEVLAEPTNRAA